MAKSAQIARLILAGLVMTGLPLLAAVLHLRNAPTDKSVRVPVSVEETLFGPRLITGVSTLNLEDLAGDDDFRPGQRAYIHSVLHDGVLAYPYAISHRRAAPSDDTISMRAIVTQRDGEKIDVDYQFEDIASRPELLRGIDDRELAAEVSVSIRAVPRLKRLTPTN